MVKEILNLTNFNTFISLIKEGITGFDYSNFSPKNDKEQSLRQLINVCHYLWNKHELHERINLYSVSEEELKDAVKGSSLEHKKTALQFYFNLI